MLTNICIHTREGETFSTSHRELDSCHTVDFDVGDTHVIFFIKTPKELHTMQLALEQLAKELAPYCCEKHSWEPTVVEGVYICSHCGIMHDRFHNIISEEQYEAFSNS